MNICPYMAHICQRTYSSLQQHCVCLEKIIQRQFFAENTRTQSKSTFFFFLAPARTIFLLESIFIVDLFIYFLCSKTVPSYSSFDSNLVNPEHSSLITCLELSASSHFFLQQPFYQSYFVNQQQVPPLYFNNHILIIYCLV